MKMRVFTITLLLIVAGLVRANYIAENTLDEKVAASDVVLIGWVRSIKPDRRPISNPSMKFVRVESHLVLKGEKAHDFTAIIGSSIAEMNPVCCVIGDAYLLFLVKDGDQYELVNPPFGIKHLGKLKRTRESRD